MRNSFEDEDFIAVKRIKRKSTDNVHLDAGYSTHEKKKRKVDEKDGKLSDVDFVDRTILRNIRVPKKIKECDDPLQRIDLLSKEFTREVTDVISRNLRDNQDTPFEIKACYLIHNRELQKRFAVKRSTLKGEAANRENFGFCFYREFAAVRELAKSGIRVGNVDSSLLGKAENGVTFSQHADVVAQPNQMYGWIIIIKYMKGRVNYVQLDNEPMEPQPGYECHLPIKQTHGGPTFPAYHYSQVYLYEYSEDFDILDYPSHILPIAAIQIAAVMNGSIAPRKKKNPEAFRPRVPNPPAVGTLMPPTAQQPLPVQHQELKVLKDMPRKSELSFCRPTPVPWGAPHSSGGFVAGSCILKIPLSVSLEAEAVIISFSETRNSLPLGISTSKMTMDRFIDLEDLYTTIFKDGNVKLSMTKELHVINVGYFNYYRMVLKDGCPIKLAMINFNNYLKATNRACVMMSHLKDATIILFPDAQVALDIGLPQSDPMAHPFSLHCIVLTGERREQYYHGLCGIGQDSKEDRTCDHPQLQTVHYRYLRYSFLQQGEAQRFQLLQQLKKKGRSGRNFQYRSLAHMEAKHASETSDKNARKEKAVKGGQSFRPKVSKEEEDDDIDDLAVLDSIDKMILDDSLNNEKKEHKKEVKNGVQFKALSDSPASPRPEKVSKIERLNAQPALMNKAERSLAHSSGRNKTEGLTIHPAASNQVERLTIHPAAANQVERLTIHPAAANQVERSTIHSAVANQIERSPGTKVEYSVGKGTPKPVLEQKSKTEQKSEGAPVISGDMKSVFSSMQSSLQSLVSTLQSQMSSCGVKPPVITPKEENEDIEMVSSEPPVNEINTKTSKDWYWFYHKKQNQGDNNTESKDDVKLDEQKPLDNSSPQILKSLQTLIPPTTSSKTDASNTKSSSHDKQEEIEDAPYIPGLGDPPPSDLFDNESPVSPNTMLSSNGSPFQTRLSSPSNLPPSNQRMGIPPTSRQFPFNPRNPCMPPPLMDARPTMNTSQHPPSNSNYQRNRLPQNSLPPRRMPPAAPYPPSRPPNPPPFPNAARFGDNGQGSGFGERFPSFRHRPPNPRPPILATPNLPTRSDNMNMMRDIDLRTIPRPSFPDRPGVLDSVHDVDMRRLPPQPRTSVYQPESSIPIREPLLREPINRSTRRISTYEPGLGFQ